MGIQWHVLVFALNTVISMRLPDSTSIFTVETWAINKALEQIKDSDAFKYIIFTDSPLIGTVIQKCVFCQ